MGYGGKQASRSGDVRRFNFTGNGSNTAFDLGFTPASQNQLIITINGLVQHYDAFSVSGSTITFTGTPAAGDTIQVTAVVDAVGVAGIPDGAIANVSSLRVTTTPMLVGNAVGTFSNPLIQAASAANSWIQINAQNLNNGNNASTDLVLARSDGTDTSGFIDVGINSNTYAQAGYSIMTPSSGYMFTNGGDLVMGTQTAHNVLFHTGNTTSASERMRIAANGTIVANATIQRTLTGDATAIKVIGSYNGNTIFEVAQSSADGIMYVRDAQGNATQLTGYPAGSSIIRGRVTVPDQPAFIASNDASYTVNAGESKVTNLGSIHLNRGGHFSSSNQRFTAPVAGLYKFTAKIYYGSVADGYYGTNVYVNGGVVSGNYYTYFRGGFGDASAIAVVTAYMAVGDYAEMRSYPAATKAVSAGYMSFSGYLIG